MSRPAVWFALGLLLAPAGARAEPLAFKGASLGAPFVSDPRYDCRAVATPLGDSICALHAHERETIAGAPVRSLFRYYAAGRLTAIVLHMDEPRFAPVVQALAGKYGPARMTRETVRNYAGKAFENQTHTWHRPEGSLTVSRYSGRLDQSSVRFVDDTAVAALKTRRGGAVPAPGQDL